MLGKLEIFPKFFGVKIKKCLKPPNLVLDDDQPLPGNSLCTFWDE